MKARRYRGSSNRLASAAAVVCAGTIVALVALPTTAFASTAPGLGTAKAYAVLAGTPNITNTGPSTISGSVGIFPAKSVIGLGGLPNGTVTNGTIQAGTAAAGTAKSDLTTAYGVAKSSPCNFNKTGVNLGGKTLTPGTYCQTTAPTLTGILTLSGNGVFIFQAGSTLVTAPASVVRLINGAQPCNVFWQVSSSATLNTTSTFVGTILALTDIHVRTGASIVGRALARNGLVTLDTNRITAPTACSPTTVSGPGVPIPSTGAGSGPMPAASVLVVIGGTLVVLSGGAAINGRRRARARR
jgi:Ice-binding-like